MSSTMNRVAASLAFAAAAGAIVATTAASPAAAAPGRFGPEPVSTRLAPVQAHSSSWVNIYWRTRTPVCNAQVQVNGGRQLAVSYPGMRRSTTFTHGDNLRPGRTAATPIRVSNVRGGSNVVVLRATMSYTDCGRHARTQWKRVDLALPVINKFRPGKPGGHNRPHPAPPAHHGQPGHPGQHGKPGHGPR